MIVHTVVFSFFFKVDFYVGVGTHVHISKTLHKKNLYTTEHAVSGRLFFALLQNVHIPSGKQRRGKWCILKLMVMKAAALFIYQRCSLFESLLIKPKPKRRRRQHRGGNKGTEGGKSIYLEPKGKETRIIREEKSSVLSVPQWLLLWKA